MRGIASADNRVYTCAPGSSLTCALLLFSARGSWQAVLLRRTGPHFPAVSSIRDAALPMVPAMLLPWHLRRLACCSDTRGCMRRPVGSPDNDEGTLPAAPGVVLR
jgi:hypothetical protein